MINTRFWVDSWISNLDPVEKLLFLYFLTNERNNLCGIYELPLKYMAIETGIDKEMVEKIIKRFTKERKVFCINGWIYLKNAQKYQNTQNESIRLGIEREKSELPAEILDKIKDIDERGGSGIPEGGMSGDTKLNLTKLNLTKDAEINSAYPIKNKLNNDIPQSLQEFVDWCKKSSQRHIQIIGEWGEAIEPKYNTRGQWQMFIKRNLRPAKDLISFTEKQLQDAFEKIQNDVVKIDKNTGKKVGFLTKYTLETLLKYL